MIWTVRKKMLLGFTVILLLLMTSVGIGYAELSSADRTYSRLIDDQVQEMIWVEDLQGAVKQKITSMRGYLIVGDKRALDEYNQANEKYAIYFNKLEKKGLAEVPEKLLRELDQIEVEYDQFSKQMFQFKDANKTDEYTTAVAVKGREIVSRFDQKVQELLQYQQETLESQSMATSHKVNSLQATVLWIGIFAILLGLTIAIYLGLHISNPVKALAASARRVASGDLTREPMALSRQDEIGELASSFDEMSDHLRSLITQIELHACQVSAASGELALGAEQTGQGTEQIATTMQEIAAGTDHSLRIVETTSSTIEEMSGHMQQMAVYVHEVNEASLRASQQADEGGQTMSSVVMQMNSIQSKFDTLSNVIGNLEGRSEEIGQIVSVIKEISVQTNLLSLNASIEAARAGEEGRGFLVVAEEIRKLADQTASSAQMIAALVESTQAETKDAVLSMDIAAKEVASGINTVQTAGDAFNNFRVGVLETATQVQKISQATDFLAEGACRIVESMSLIRSTAENLAAGTEEVSATSEEQLGYMEEMTASSENLSEMAEELQSLVERFKV